MFPVFICFVVLIAKALLVLYSLAQIQKAYIDYKVNDFDSDAEFYGYEAFQCASRNCGVCGK
jgi:hypothetical protein